MNCQTQAGVAKSWHPWFYLLLVLIGIIAVCFILASTVIILSDVNIVVAIVAGITAAALGTIFFSFVVFKVSNKLSSKQRIRISETGIDFSRYGHFRFKDIRSYDTNVSDYRNRLYLVVRPKGRVSLRILSGPQEEFAQFCRTFERQVALEAERLSCLVNTSAGDSAAKRFLRLCYLGKVERPVPLGVPVKRSFYGSPLARLIGVLGLVALGGGVIGALLVDPALAVYAVLLAVAGGAPMLILALGGRAE